MKNRPFYEFAPAKAGYAVFGGLAGGWIGAATCGLLYASIAGSSAALVGFVIGAFADHDFDESVYRAGPKERRLWKAVGYSVLVGGGISLIGLNLVFFVQDWRPFFLSSIGMAIIVAALAYGERLAKEACVKG